MTSLIQSAIWDGEETSTTVPVTLWFEEEARRDWIVASMADGVRAQKKTFAPSERLEL